MCFNVHSKQVTLSLPSADLMLQKNGVGIKNTLAKVKAHARLGEGMFFCVLSVANKSFVNAMTVS